MKKIILRLIKIYQNTFSPDHGQIFYGNFVGCRFYPSCSQYACESISRHGLVSGVLKSILRILKCNPLSKGGVDLVS